MKNAIIAGARQLTIKKLLSCIFAVYILIILTLTKELMQIFPLTSLLSYGYHTSLIQKGLRTDTVCSFIPIISVLPYAANYIDDIKSKFARYICIRSSYNSYILTHVILCFTSGGFVFLAGILLAWITLAVVFLPLEETQMLPVESMQRVLPSYGLVYLSGGFWAVVGMTVSTIMESKYIAYASPFVIYYILVICCDRYWGNSGMLYPPSWTNPDVWPYGVWGAGIFILELTALCGIFFAVRADRRLREL